MITVKELMDFIKDNNISQDTIIPNVDFDSIYLAKTSNRTIPIFDMNGYFSTVSFTTDKDILCIEPYTYNDLIQWVSPPALEPTEEEFKQWKELIKSAIKFPDGMNSIDKDWIKKNINHAFVQVVGYNCFNFEYGDEKLYE